MSVLLFDLRAAQPLAHGHHGGAEYARSVFKQLVCVPGDLVVSAVYDEARPMPEDIERAARGANVSLTAITELSELQDLVADPNVKRFYSALPYAYENIDFGNLEVVFTVHGLRPIETPTDQHQWRFESSLRGVVTACLKSLFRSPYREYKKRQFAKVLRPKCRKLRLIVPSLHTKYSILNHYPWVEEKDIHVYFSPPTEVCARSDTDSSRLASLGLDARQFILLVSSGRWIKNSYRALTELRAFFEEHPEFSSMKIAAVGGAPQRFSPGSKMQLVHLDDLSVSDLATLYANAFVLVYPSLNEGFGYPPVEAMSYGTPAIVSAVCSMPEVCSSGVLYSAPLVEGEIANRLLYLLSEPAAWHKSSEKAAQRYAFVSQKQTEMLNKLCQLLVSSND